MKPTLFLLPGLLCDERVWAHQAQHLASLADIRIPDFSQLDSLDAMADAVLHQAPEQFMVAGHSMGGRVALQILSKAPDRILKLGLLDTGTHAAKPGEAEKRQLLIDLAEREGMGAMARAWAPPMVHPARHVDADLMGAIYAMVENYSVLSFRKQVNALLNRPDASPFLAKAPANTLVLCGREDAWSPPEQHEVISQALPDRSPVVIIERSGHMAPMEQPEAVTAAMSTWLGA
jgi:pimeloyl-ACP methyl ester carboxylesterase